MTFANPTRRAFLSGTLMGAAALAFAPGARVHASASTLTARILGDIGAIDPAFWQSGADFDTMNLIHGKLIDFIGGEEWKWELVAAESIERLDDTHTRFRLRPGLTWTNGYGAVSAEDVKFSFERYIDPALEAPNGPDWSPLSHVEVIDELSGVIVTKEPFAPMWWSVLPYSAGYVLCKRAVEEAGGKFSVEAPATCGPYRIESWQPNERLTLVRHEGWTGPRPHFDRIVLVPIGDPKIAEKGFLAGELDFTHVSESSVPVFQENPPEDATLTVRPSLDYYWLGINRKHPKYTDLRVRKAIGKAIDVGAILEGAFFGAARGATSMIAPGMPGHVEGEPPARDLEGARALMADAGKAQGFAAELDIIAETDRLSAAQIIQANLADIGIDLTINSHERGAYWSLAEEKGEAGLEMTYKLYFQPPDPVWGTQWFLSEQVGIWNWEWFSDPEYDALHYQAIAELDPVKRHELYVRMMQIMEGSGCFVWIAHPPQASLTRKGVEAAIWPNGNAAYRLFRGA